MLSWPRGADMRRGCYAAGAANRARALRPARSRPPVASRRPSPPSPLPSSTSDRSPSSPNLLLRHELSAHLGAQPADVLVQVATLSGVADPADNVSSLPAGDD